MRITTTAQTLLALSSGLAACLFALAREAPPPQTPRPTFVLIDENDALGCARISRDLAAHFAVLRVDSRDLDQLERISRSERRGAMHLVVQGRAIERLQNYLSRNASKIDSLWLIGEQETTASQEQAPGYRILHLDTADDFQSITTLFNHSTSGDASA